MSTTPFSKRRTTDKMNAVNNTYRFFVAGKRVATGRILKDRTILQVYPYERAEAEFPGLYRYPKYLPPFKSLRQWQNIYEHGTGTKIDYIEEEGAGQTWRHERFPNPLVDTPAPPAANRPPFLETVSPKVRDVEDPWEAVRSNAPDAPRNADAQREKHLKTAIESLYKTLEELKLV
jgi:hypothetical protein